MDYPEYIEVNGNEYKIDTDYRVALTCLKLSSDSTISDTERFYAILCLLLGTDVKPEDEKEAFEKCAIYLRCGREFNISNDEIDMDYEQDSGFINASFRSCYQMDLKKENLHWWEFNDLIAGFGEQEVMTRIRIIRNKKLSDCNDEKEREELKKQKELFSLKKKNINQISEENKEIDDLFNKLSKKKGE